MRYDETITPIQYDRRLIAGLAFMAAVTRTAMHYQAFECRWLGFVRSGGMVQVVPS